jgi:hypothetical protein
VEYDSVSEASRIQKEVVGSGALSFDEAPRTMAANGCSLQNASAAEPSSTGNARRVSKSTRAFIRALVSVQFALAHNATVYSSRDAWFLRYDSRVSEEAHVHNTS